jgi:xylulokinase
MSGYFLGIDLGSSSLKISFLSTDCSVTGPFSREIPGVFPQAGWTEQHPELWYRLLCDLLSESFARTSIKPSEIIAIAIDGATHTTVLLDKDYRPLRPAIMWNDQRAADVASRLPRELHDEIFGKTYHPPGAMWSLCQNLWVAENQPELWQKVKFMMFAKDYLRFRLTGEYVTDFIDAQGSQFYDMKEMCWSRSLCALMGFEADYLPHIQKSTDLAGAIMEMAAKETGLTVNTKVFTGTTDTAMEVLAAGAIRPGQSTLKLATSGRICVVTDKAYPHLNLVNYSHVIDGLWYPGTGTRSCATSLRWFKDNFAQYEHYVADAGGKNVYKLLDELASHVPVGTEGLFFHPYLLGEFTPYRNAHLRASFIGAGMNHTRGHFIRAILEGTAYSLRDCMQVLQMLDITAKGTTKLIGGGSSSALWAQITADVMDRELETPKISDSSFGSAMLGAVGYGHFNSFQEAVAACFTTTGIITPIPGNTERYDRLFLIYKDIVAKLVPVYDELAELLKESRQA